MHAPLMSPFADATAQPLDATVALLARFRGDPRTVKMNLACGTFVGSDGEVPLMRAVHDAEIALAAEARPRDYQAMVGDERLIRVTRELLLGSELAESTRHRLAALQTLGGTGALRVAADLLHALMPSARVYVSRPTWGNHPQIFGAAGFEVREYPYVDTMTGAPDFAGMTNALRHEVPRGSIIVLHTSCHNPTGFDPSSVQWAELADIFVEKGLIALHDIAYQGLGEGLDEDVQSLRMFVARGIPTLVAHSLSKSFSLYGERVGTLLVTCADATEAHRVGSMLQRSVRTNYSTPPIHGASLIVRVLEDPALRESWKSELAGMGEHVRAMRRALIGGLQEAGLPVAGERLGAQKGLFCFSGIPPEVIDRLRTERGIYLLRSGRLCLAALDAPGVRRFVTAVSEAWAVVA